MSKPIFMLLGAGLLSLAMWVWVQDVAIPNQVAESAERGSPRGNLSDLYPRWLGARELLLRGRDPYSAEITREIQVGYYGRELDPARPNDPRDQQAFAYPVYVVFLLAPFVALPFVAVQKVFLWLFVALTAASVLWWMQALGWRISTTARWSWILLTLGCFPAIQGLKLQQLTLLVAALLAAFLNAVARGHLIRAGILLALATVKPQLAALPAIWMCIWVLGDWRGRQRLLWSCASSIAVLFIAGELILPGWVREFRTASAAYYVYTGGGRSVLDVLLTPAWGRAIAPIVAGLCLGLAWRVRNAAADHSDFHWSLALVMSTTLLVIPMFAPYNQLLLIPAVMVVVRAVRELWSANRLSRFLVAVTGFAVFWPWLAAALLALAMLAMPAIVWKAWAMPLYTSLAIPVTVWAVLLIGGPTIRSGDFG